LAGGVSVVFSGGGAEQPRAMVVPRTASQDAFESGRMAVVFAQVADGSKRKSGAFMLGQMHPR
jgi:hypothetical protein